MITWATRKRAFTSLIVKVRASRGRVNGFFPLPLVVTEVRRLESNTGMASASEAEAKATEVPWQPPGPGW